MHLKVYNAGRHEQKHPQIIKNSCVSRTRLLFHQCRDELHLDRVLAKAKIVSSSEHLFALEDVVNSKPTLDFIVQVGAGNHTSFL